MPDLSASSTWMALSAELDLWQGNHIPGDNPTQAALSNGQVFIQKTTGWWQFYVQAGAYNILALGTPFLPTEKAVTDLYGAGAGCVLEAGAGEEHLHSGRSAAYIDGR